MHVAYAPSELMHEAKDGAHLISHAGGVHLTETSCRDLTHGTARPQELVSLHCCLVGVQDVAPLKDLTGRQAVFENACTPFIPLRVSLRCACL
jgi:hypothetical protein